MTKAFSQMGGATYGDNPLLAFHASWPFATLIIDDTALILACMGKQWVFPKNSSLRLSKRTQMLSVGLRIEHANENYEYFIVFWGFQFTRIRRELELRGYSVHESASYH
jgi:hypothetical protein